MLIIKPKNPVRFYFCSYSKIHFIEYDCGLPSVTEEMHKRKDRGDGEVERGTSSIRCADADFRKDNILLFPVVQYNCTKTNKGKLHFL